MKTGEGIARQVLSWRAGDNVVLTLDLPVRVTEPDPRIDAVRGCVAVERGPLVYCVESDDVPADVELEELVWDASRSRRRRRGRISAIPWWGLPSRWSAGARPPTR